MMPYKDPEQRRQRHAEYLRERYRTDEEYRKAHLMRVRKVSKEAARKLKLLIEAIKKEKGCAICKETDPIVLVFHHLDSSKKDFAISKAIGTRYSVKRILHEIEKCAVVCANCHLRIHAGTLMRGRRRKRKS
jgi:hypothetical protein